MCLLYIEKPSKPDSHGCSSWGLTPGPKTEGEYQLLLMALGPEAARWAVRGLGARVPHRRDRLGRIVLVPALAGDGIVVGRVGPRRRLPLSRCDRPRPVLAARLAGARGAGRGRRRDAVGPGTGGTGRALRRRGRRRRPRDHGDLAVDARRAAHPGGTLGVGVQPQHRFALGLGQETQRNRDRGRGTRLGPAAAPAHVERDAGLELQVHLGERTHHDDLALDEGLVGLDVRRVDPVSTVVGVSLVPQADLLPARRAAMGVADHGALAIGEPAVAGGTAQTGVREGGSRAHVHALRGLLDLLLGGTLGLDEGQDGHLTGSEVACADLVAGDDRGARRHLRAGDRRGHGVSHGAGRDGQQNEGRDQRDQELQRVGAHDGLLGGRDGAADDLAVHRGVARRVRHVELLSVDGKLFAIDFTV